MKAFLNDELFSTGRAIRRALLVATVVLGFLGATGIVTFFDNLLLNIALWPIRLAALSLLFLATVPVSDAEILSFYSAKAPRMVARYGKHRLRPVLDMDYPAGECGRYRGEPLVS